MYRVLIELKKDISDETLKELTEIINSAFDNEEGKVARTKTESPYCFEFSGDKEKWSCLDLSAEILKEYKLFWDNVIVWKWEEDDEYENHNLIDRKINVGFGINGEELEVYYPEDDWEKGYDDIKVFMSKHGFELYTEAEPTEILREYLFKSQKYLFEDQVEEILLKLIEEHPWMHKCGENLEVWETYGEKSLMHLFSAEKTEASDE